MSGESWKKIQAQCTSVSQIKKKKPPKEKVPKVAKNPKVPKVSGTFRDIRMAMLLKKEEARQRDRLAMNRLQYNNYGTQNIFQYSPKFAALTSINPLSQDLRFSVSHNLTKVEHSDKPSIRCFVCSIELSLFTRCSVYDHYSVHFQDQLIKNNESRSECRICLLKYSKPRRLAVHIGRGHSLVEQFIPQTARINPNSSLSAGIKEEVKPEVKLEPFENRKVSVTKQREKVCYICKKTVRYRKFNDMLDHYCNHLKVELSVFNSNTSSCDYCEKTFDPNVPKSLYRHVGLTHKKILELIPEDAKLETNFTVSLDVSEISAMYPKLKNETSKSQTSTTIGDSSGYVAAAESQTSTTIREISSHKAAAERRTSTPIREIASHIAAAESQTSTPIREISSHIAAAESRTSKPIREISSHIAAAESQTSKPIKEISSHIAAAESQTSKPIKEKVCYICKKTVRYKWFNEMLDHYCNHLKVELSGFNSNTSSCDYCEKTFDPNDPPRVIYRHVGLTHKKILELIPEDAKLETNSAKSANSQTSTPINNLFSHVSMKPPTVGTSKDRVVVEKTTDGSVQIDGRKKQTSCCICSRMIDCSTRTNYYYHFIPHFREELLNIVTGLDCHLCSKSFPTKYRLLVHVGVKHRKLFDYMPEKGMYEVVFARKDTHKDDKLEKMEVVEEKDGDKIRVEKEEKHENGMQKEENGMKKEEDGVQKEEDGVKKEEDGVKKEEDGVKKEEDGMKKEEDGMQKEKVVLKNEKVVLKNEKVVLKNEKVVLKNEKVVLKKEKVVLKNKKVVLKNEKVVLKKEKVNSNAEEKLELNGDKETKKDSAKKVGIKNEAVTKEVLKEEGQTSKKSLRKVTRIDLVKKRSNLSDEDTEDSGVTELGSTEEEDDETPVDPGKTSENESTQDSGVSDSDSEQKLSDAKEKIEKNIRRKYKRSSPKNETYACFKCNYTFTTVPGTSYGKCESKMYSHYVKHYKEELSKFFVGNTCKLCNKQLNLKKHKLIRHVAIAHKKLYSLLPPGVLSPASTSVSSPSLNTNISSEHNNSDIEIVQEKPAVYNILEKVEPGEDLSVSFGDIVLVPVSSRKRKKVNHDGKDKNASDQQLIESEDDECFTTDDDEDCNVEEYCNDKDNKDDESKSLQNTVIKCTTKTESSNPICFLCSKPLETRSRTLFYDHYVRHFQKEISEFIINERQCTFCNEALHSTRNTRRHVFVIHEIFKDHIPENHWYERFVSNNKRKYKKMKIKKLVNIDNAKEVKEDPAVAMNKISETSRLVTVSRKLRKTRKVNEKWISNPKLTRKFKLIMKRRKNKAALNLSASADKSNSCPVPTVCYICSKSVKITTKTLFYCHHVTHFRKQLLRFCNDQLECELCNKTLPTKNSVMRHIGIYHNKIEDLLPEEEKFSAFVAKIKNGKKTLRIEDIDKDSILLSSEVNTPTQIDDKVQMNRTRSKSLTNIGIYEHLPSSGRRSRSFSPVATSTVPLMQSTPVGSRSNSPDISAEILNRSCDLLGDLEESPVNKSNSELVNDTLNSSDLHLQDEVFDSNDEFSNFGRFLRQKNVKRSPRSPKKINSAKKARKRRQSGRDPIFKQEIILKKKRKVSDQQLPTQRRKSNRERKAKEGIKYCDDDNHALIPLDCQIFKAIEKSLKKC